MRNKESKTGGGARPRSLVGLSWSLMNAELLRCESLPTLQRWLSEMMASDCGMNRVLRVHGRMNLVRRAAELKALKAVVRASHQSNGGKTTKEHDNEEESQCGAAAPEPCS